ncbi:MAG: PTS glucose transporter subunit IIA [Clostridiaceae bacterium]
MSKFSILNMPVKGKVSPLSELNDYLFKGKLMGEGAVITPTDNYLYSPVDGEVILVYKTKHAIGIKSNDGLKILIHFGLDTAKLEGKGIANYVKVGDKVKIGDKIMFFDIDYIEKFSSIATPIVVTNHEMVKDIDVNFNAKNLSDEFLKITLS